MRVDYLAGRESTGLTNWGYMLSLSLSLFDYTGDVGRSGQADRFFGHYAVEVLTWRGLVTYYVLFFLHLETRRVSLAGITRHPTQEWMTQMACNGVDDESGYLRRHRYVLHDRDSKFCADFRKTLATGGVKCLRLPPRSPNLNAFAERWVRSVKSECLSHFILFGEGSLRRAMKNFCEHYHGERNHQGKGNVLLFPGGEDQPKRRESSIECRERLGGLLKYYYRRAA